MLPKIATALARVLDPIRPIARPGQSMSLTKSAEGGDGGHGPLGYEAPPEKEKKRAHDQPSARKNTPEPESSSPPESAEKVGSALSFQPGLTQVILDLGASRVERSAGAAVQSYETGAKDQKKNARLPKGSMLDKKVG